MRISILLFALIVSSACASHPMLAIREDLCKLRPTTEEPDSSLSIGSKLAVVYRDATFEHHKFGGCELDGYTGIEKVEPRFQPSDRYAATPDEVNTVVLIETRKGDLFDSAEARRTLSTKTETNIFLGKVTLSLVDRQSGKLIRRSTFTTRDVPKEVPQSRLKFVDSRYEYVCEPTVKEVRENLDRLMS